MKNSMKFNVLTVKGKVKTDSVESTRQMHNQTAGNPDGVDAAKALGDLSHMTYMPYDPENDFNNNLLFLDIWNNMEGMQDFFSDPQVQAGASMLFETREAILWNKLYDFLNFQFPAPFGKNERIVALLQGKINSIEKAEEIHNKAIANTVNLARNNGIVSHSFYHQIPNNETEDTVEILGIDIWMNAAGMMNYYSSPEFQDSGIYTMFSGKPSSSVWIHPEGQWVEW